MQLRININLLEALKKTVCFCQHFESQTPQIETIVSKAGEKFLRFTGRSGGKMGHIMTSSKTAFCPSCMRAEHSKYLAAPISPAICSAACFVTINNPFACNSQTEKSRKTFWIDRISSLQINLTQNQKFCDKKRLILFQKLYFKYFQISRTTFNGFCGANKKVSTFALFRLNSVFGQIGSKSYEKAHEHQTQSFSATLTSQNLT